MYYSLKYIIDSLPKKKNSKSSLWVKLVVRKLSFIFTYCFINTGFTAWGVSIVSVFVAVLGCIFLMIKNRALVIIGMIMVQLWLVLDCVDGNIARCKKTSSEMGSFIDALSGYYVSAFVYFAVGITAYNYSNVEYKELFVLLGAISSISGILSRLIHQKYTYTIMKIEEKKEPMRTPEDEVENKRSLQYLRSRADKELGISGLFMPFLLISTLINSYELLTVFYFAFQTGGLIAVTIYYSYKAK